MCLCSWRKSGENGSIDIAADISRSNHYLPSAVYHALLRVWFKSTRQFRIYWTDTLLLLWQSGSLLTCYLELTNQSFVLFGIVWD